MGQKKLIRFAEIKTFANVLENPQDMKGHWKAFFRNDNPLVLELACGKGEYAVGLGRLHKDKNYIGVDLKGNRMWVGAKTALAEGLNNVAFLRTQIEKISDYFNEGEVAEIWITFPDPQLRVSKAKKRLTHPRFLRLYKSILAQHGIIHLKTDSPNLYGFTKLVINLFDLPLLQDCENIQDQIPDNKDLQIKTHYESLDIAQSKRIHYLQFEISKPLTVEIDELLKKILFEQATN